MQDNEKHNIDELFRKGMTRLPEEKPSLSGWDNLKKEMGKEGLKMEVLKKGNTFFNLSVFSGIVLGAGALAYYFFTNDSNTKNNSITTFTEIAKTETTLTEKINTDNNTEKTSVSNENEIAKNTISSTSNEAMIAETEEQIEVKSEVEKAEVLNAEIIKTEAKKTKANTNTGKKSLPISKPNVKSENNIVKGKNNKSLSIESDSTTRPTTYRVQVGAFKGRVSDSTFNGIKNLKSEYSPIDGLTRFYDGKVYTSKEDAKIALEKIRKNGFEDAFINIIQTPEKKATAQNTTTPNTTTNKIEETKVEEKTVITAKVDSIVKKPSDSVRAEIAKAKSASADSTAAKAKVDSVKKKDIAEPKQEVTPKKYCIGVYASLDRNYYAVKSGNTTLTGGISSFGDSIYGIPSWGQYTIGITGGYKVSRRILVETGLFYSQKKKIVYDSPDYDILQNSGGSSNWTINRFVYHHNAKYLQLFLKMKIYYLERERIRLFASPGFIFESNMPASKENKSYYTYESVSNTTYTKDKYVFSSSSIGSNISISTGVEFKLNGNWVLALEPSYNYKLNQEIRFKSSTEVSPVKHYNRALCFGVRLLKEF